MHVTQDPQSHLADLPFADFIFKATHPLLQLAAAIHWPTLLEQLQDFYSPDQGRPSIPLRAQAGTLMLKHLKHLPDRDAVRYVEENLYAQRFCGLTPAQAVGYMHPATGLTNFRAKIGPEGMAWLQEVLTCAAEGKSLKRGDKFILDTTCVPLDLHYPTDIRLLEQCRRGILRLFQQAKRLGMEVAYRTYRRTAQRVFVRFAKLAKSTAATRRRVHKQMWQFVRRNCKQLGDLRQRATRGLGPRCPTEPAIRKFLQTLKATERRTQVILHQQRLVRQGLRSIPQRIVSFHKDHVRPIVRGKFPLSTEFGPKVLVALVRGCLHVVEAFRDNRADASLLTPALRWFKTRFRRFPKALLGDRGFYARWRARWLQARGITSGLQARGKSQTASSPAQRRHIRQRLPIEALISLAKRKFGWDKCRVRNPDHELSWVGLGAAALNAHRAFLMPPPSSGRPRRGQPVRSVGPQRARGAWAAGPIRAGPAP